MSMMHPNGIITEELCPFCDNPEPVTVRHGRNDNGSFVHDYDCDVCGGDMSIVGYHCPECAVSQPTKDALDDGESKPLGGLLNRKALMTHKEFYDRVAGIIENPALVEDDTYGLIVAVLEEFRLDEEAA